MGRHELVDRVCESLSEEGGPLVTLTGRGGVGKSRVAIAACRLLVDRYPDGIHYAALSRIDDAGQLLPAIASAVDVQPRRGGRLLDQLADGLTGHRLLVLDGFEQFRAATLTISALLDSCPGLTMLITDRWPIHLAGERVIRVPGLRTAAAAALLSAAELSEYPAIQLFVDRARARKPEFRLQADNAGAVAEICHRLDGVPLAIELAAGLVQFLDPTTILTHADNWLAMLANGAEDGPPHQRSVRASIDRSYRLLAAGEQSMLRRISVFTGNITIEAAACTAGVSTKEAIETLAALVDKGLLVRQPEGAPSFLLAEVVREFAAERLTAAAEKSESCRSHAQFFLELVEQSEPQSGTSQQVGWLDRIDRQLPNIRAAMRYFLDNDGQREALRMGVALEQYWWVGGDLAESRDWLVECLDRQQENSVLRARAGGIAATISSRMLDLDGAEALAEAGLRLGRALEDPIAVARAQEAIGIIAGVRALPDEGQRAFGESIDIWRQAGDQARLARSLEYSAEGLLWQGDLPAAAAQVGLSLQVLRSLEDPAQLAASVITLGLILTYDGKFEAALAELQSGLATALKLRSRRHLSRAHFGLGLLSLREGQPRAAEGHLATAIAMVAESGDRSFLPGCVLALSTVYEADRPDEAVLLLAAATAQAGDVGLRAPGLLRVDYEQLILSLQQRLGAARFDAAWSRGSRISRNEVLLTQIAPPRDSRQPTAEAILTKREIEVLTLVARGLNGIQFAEKLTVSRRTVHAHLRAIYRKLDLHTRSAATLYAVAHGLR